MDSSKQQWQSESDTIEYLVYSISVGDVDIPDLLVNEPIYMWQQTDAGKYVMENSSPEPMLRRVTEQADFCYKYSIYAYFTPQQLTYYTLRFE